MNNYRKLRRILADNLAAIMESRPGLDTQAALAARSGINQTTIGRVLRTEVSITLDSLEAIADALGVSASVLVQNVKDCGAPSIYLDSRLASLSQSEAAQISAFIEFTINKKEQEARGLSFKETKAPPKGMSAAIQRAAKRPMGGGFSFEETSNPEGRQSTRKRRRK